MEPQPSIWLKGVRIDEPVTMVTDLLVSAICFYAFYQLQRSSSPNKIIQFLKYYFLSMAFATAIGGIIGHGFMYAFTFAWKLPGWLLSMFSITLIERAVIENVKPIVSSKLVKFFTFLNIFELSVFVILTFSTLNFLFVEIHAAYGLLVVVASFSSYAYIKTKNPGSKYFIFGVLFCAVSALFFMNEWSLNTWFNYLDISHVFMAIAAFLFYRGARMFIN